MTWSPSVVWPACRRRPIGDLSFDIEGDPFALEDGLDYLFGVMDRDGTFHAIWSRDTTTTSRSTASGGRSSSSST